LLFGVGFIGYSGAKYAVIVNVVGVQIYIFLVGLVPWWNQTYWRRRNLKLNLASIAISIDIVVAIEVGRGVAAVQRFVIIIQIFANSRVQYETGAQI
jgi:hypothetical protein